MAAVSFEKARKNLKQVLNQVHENNETMTIVRDNGRNAVIMPEQEYNQLMETMYLLQNPKKCRADS